MLQLQHSALTKRKRLRRHTRGDRGRRPYLTTRSDIRRLRQHHCLLSQTCSRGGFFPSRTVTPAAFNLFFKDELKARRRKKKS